MTVGLESAVHVFFALLSLLASAALLALVYRRAANGAPVKILAVAVAILLWLSWFTVIPVYTVLYSADKSVIVANPATAAAHKFGMETKEHIFYTGLVLATLAPIATYALDLNSTAGRRFMIWLLLALIIGGLIMESLGGWVAIAAKQAWAAKAGG